MLSLTLRYCAGGSYLDLAYMHGLHRSTLYDCMWSVIEAADRKIRLKFDIDDGQAVSELAKGFRRRGRVRDLVNGCVMAYEKILMITR